MRHGSFALLWAPRGRSCSEQLRANYRRADARWPQLWDDGQAVALHDQGVGIWPLRSGAALVEGYWFHGSHHCDADLASLSVPPTSSGFGAFTKVQVESTGIYAYADPVGSQQIFYSTPADGQVLISNDLLWHACALRLMGRAPQVDLLSLSTLMGVGSAIAPWTSLNGVKLLPTGHQLSVDVDGRWEIALMGEPRHYFAGISDEVLYERAAEELKANMAAAREHFHDESHVVELTGGMDSRLVYGASLSLGDTSGFGFYTRGGERDPDKRAAGALLNAFGQRSCNAPYTYETVSRDQFTRAAARCGGIRTADDIGYFMEKSYEDRVVYTGGFGETFRNFYAEVMIADPLLEDDGLFSAPPAGKVARAALRRTFRGRKLLTKGSDDAIQERLASALVAYDQPFGDALRTFYNESRNRFHYGMSARIRSGYLPCLQILHSPAANEAARRLSPRQQAQGVVTVRVLQELFPALLCIPFAQKRVPAEAMSGKLWAPFVLAQQGGPPASVSGAPPKAEPDLMLHPGASPTEVRATYISNALHFTETMPDHVEAVMNAEAVLATLRGSDRDKAFTHAKHVIAPFGWLALIERINASEPASAFAILRQG